jgi:hypothetical protein
MNKIIESIVYDITLQSKFSSKTKLTIKILAGVFVELEPNLIN